MFSVVLLRVLSAHGRRCSLEDSLSGPVTVWKGSVWKNVRAHTSRLPHEGQEATTYFSGGWDELRSCWSRWGLGSPSQLLAVWLSCLPVESDLRHWIFIQGKHFKLQCSLERHVLVECLSFQTQITKENKNKEASVLEIEKLECRTPFSHVTMTRSWTRLFMFPTLVSRLEVGHSLESLQFTQ